MVIFWDGSEEAYGVVVYIRWRSSSGEYICRLAASKCRIAPMKKISVVRLELNSAVMATRLKSFICEHVRYTFDKIYFIGDSRIVHAMVKRDTYGFNTYIASLLNILLQYMATMLQYIPSKLSSQVASSVTRRTESRDMTTEMMTTEIC